MALQFYAINLQVAITFANGSFFVIYAMCLNAVCNDFTSLQETNIVSATNNRVACDSLHTPLLHLAGTSGGPEGPFPCSMRVCVSHLVEWCVSSQHDVSWSLRRIYMYLLAVHARVVSTSVKRSVAVRLARGQLWILSTLSWNCARRSYKAKNGDLILCSFGKWVGISCNLKKK